MRFRYKRHYHKVRDEDGRVIDYLSCWLWVQREQRDCDLPDSTSF